MHIQDLTLLWIHIFILIAMSANKASALANSVFSLSIGLIWNTMQLCNWKYAVLTSLFGEKYWRNNSFNDLVPCWSSYFHRQLPAQPFRSISWKHSRPKRWLSIKLYKPLIFKVPAFNHYATLRYRWYNRRLFLSNETTTTNYSIPLRSSLVHGAGNICM